MIFSDASWKVDRTYAGFFVLYCNAAVDWASKLLKVQMSSSEAEIGAGSMAGKRAVYLRHYLGCIAALPRLRLSHVVDNSALPRSPRTTACRASPSTSAAGSTSCVTS